jgi:hypothetical protein
MFGLYQIRKRKGIFEDWNFFWHEDAMYAKGILKFLNAGFKVLRHSLLSGVPSGGRFILRAIAVQWFSRLVQTR